MSEFEEQLTEFHERIGDYRRKADEIRQAPDALEGFRTATDVIGSPLAIELLKSGIKARYEGVGDKVLKGAMDLKDRTIKAVRDRIMPDPDPDPESVPESVPTSRSFIGKVIPRSDDEPFGIADIAHPERVFSPAVDGGEDVRSGRSVRNLFRKNLQKIKEDTGIKSDELAGQELDTGLNIAAETGAEGEELGAGIASGLEGAGEAIAESTGAETEGLGLIAGGALALGGVLASVFAPHKHHKPPPPPNLSHAALQVGI